MRVLVATAAVQVCPVIDHSRLRLELRRFLMTFRAGRRHVATGQREAGVFVLGQGKRRWLVTFEIVAAVAGVEVRSRRKLPGMLIGVAVNAAIKFDFEQSVFALGNMALRAFQARMSTLQRIRSARVLFDREQRWLPALHRMTG